MRGMVETIFLARISLRPDGVCTRRWTGPEGFERSIDMRFVLSMASEPSEAAAFSYNSLVLLRCVMRKPLLREFRRSRLKYLNM